MSTEDSFRGPQTRVGAIKPSALAEDLVLERLSAIGEALSSLAKRTEDQSRVEGLGALHEQESATEVVLAAVLHCPEALTLMAACGPRLELGLRPVQSILLTTKRITTGGVSMVLISQARYLMEAGYDVTIAATGQGSDSTMIPAGAEFVELGTSGLAEKAAQWGVLCQENAIDLIIDHQTLYSRDWPAYVLMARALNVPTIGWIHNFAGRPIYDLTSVTSFLTEHMAALAQVVTLSPLDVIFWKLRGIEHTAYLPNPISPMILDAAHEHIVKSAPENRRLELVWWGRLDDHTKQVRHLLAVATELKKAEVDFRLRIIGPAWRNLTPAKLDIEVRKQGLGEYVKVLGPLHGQDLVDAADAADMFVSTSIVEGYQLTLLEAQARGLPVVMYHMPWLLPVQENAGVVSVPQADPAALAREIVAIAEDSGHYKELSSASLDATDRARAFNYLEAYRQLIDGRLSEEFSPTPTLPEAEQLITLLLFFVERHAGLRTRMARRRAAAQTTPRPSSRSLAVRALTRVTQRARPYGRLALSMAPGLKPLAHRVNYALKRRLPL